MAATRHASLAPTAPRRGSRRGTIALAVGGVGLLICLLIGWTSVKDGLDAPGGVTLAIGTLAALTGTFFCLALLLLISRVPWLEREVGHDRMLMLHRQVAPYALLLIGLHVVFTMISYAQITDDSFLGEVWTTVTQTAWMLPAAVAFVLMMSLGVMSWRRIRSRMKYETWWAAHLYFYIAVVLALGHQLEMGPMFLDHPMQRWFWIGLYVAVGVTILLCRFMIPIVRSLRHRITVASVVQEADGVMSVYLHGRQLDKLNAQGGQFFQWRFMTRHWWWQAHPYSLSATPNPSWLRVTVKSLGDQSAFLHELRPGTRVLAEGPYGVFTAAARHGDKVTAFAAGVGITPIRAMLDDLPVGADVALVYRVTNIEGAPLRSELEELVLARGWRLWYLPGPRHHHPLTADSLIAMVPRLADSDVYVCGPQSFTASIITAVRDAGVQERRIHHEAFSF